MTIDKGWPISCPHCGADRETVVHHGVSRPHACGAELATWLTRFFRWCWIKPEHMHLRCTNCRAEWLSPLNRETSPLYATGFDDGVKHARREMRP